MKRVWKTLLSGALALVLVLSLAACGSDTSSSGGNSTSSTGGASGGSSTAEPQEPLVVNVLYMHSFSANPAAGNAMHQWLLENMNIDLRITVDSDTEQFENKLNMMLAGGLDYDVIGFLTSENTIGTVNKMGDSGLIVSVDEYLDKYPSLNRQSDEEYSRFVYANKTDDKMYMVTGAAHGMNEAMQLNIGPIIREDWLEQVNMNMPTTTEELYDVLAAFQEQVGTYEGQTVIPASFNYLRQYFGYTWSHNWYQMDEDATAIQWYWQTDGIGDYLRYMNRLQRENLLDAEVFTQTEDIFQSKLANGRVGFTLVTNDVMDNINTLLGETDGNARFVPVPPLKTSADAPYPVYQSYNLQQYVGLMVAKDFAETGDNMDRFMEFLAWSCESENNVFLNDGITADGQDLFGKYIDNGDGTFTMTPENLELYLSAGNPFQQETGLSYYNLTRKTADAADIKVKPTYTAETEMAQTTWKPALQEIDPYFDMAGVGPLWNDYWATLWGEWNVLEANAVNAKTDTECEAAIEASYKYFDENGGTAVAEEKLELYKALLEEVNG